MGKEIERKEREGRGWQRVGNERLRGKREGGR